MSGFFLELAQVLFVDLPKALFLDFEDFIEELCWYLLDAFDFVAHEFLAFLLVFASYLQQFIGSLFFQFAVS